MTNPALYSVSDAIDALDAAIRSPHLTLIQRQILTDMRDDLDRADMFDTFATVVDLAHKAAALGYS